jgi:hypothetical protein
MEEGSGSVRGWVGDVGWHRMDTAALSCSDRGGRRRARCRTTRLTGGAERRRGLVVAVGVQAKVRGSGAQCRPVRF